MKKESSVSTPQIICTKNCEHYIWGNNCDGWWLKKNDNFTVISELMPKGTSEIKHYHNTSEQFFYILEGTITIEINDSLYNLQKNEAITIAPNTTHRVFNDSNNIAKFLVVSCPNSHKDRVNVDSGF